MFRTLISLCALLAALFFVFRGIQESSANGQSPATESAAARLHRQMILQRARELHRKAAVARSESSEQAMLRVLAEVDYSWRLIDLLAEDPAQPPELVKQPIQPSYQQFLTYPSDDPPEPADVEPAPEADSGSETKPALTEAQRHLRDKIQKCLEIYQSKLELSAADYNCWEVMHTIIGYGVENHVWKEGHRYNAIGYLCYDGKCGKYHLFQNRGGQLQALQGVGVQGHHGQFLAMLAQHRVSPNYLIKVGEKDFTIHDLIEFEKETCVPKSELTFKLISLVHYLDSDETWSNRYGRWSIPRLIEEELAQPVIGSACGGTHRLMGLSYAARYREQRGEPIEGQWARAAKYIDDYQAYAFSLQNPNGSFSTKWFEGRADNRDVQRYQETSGHIVEWLAFSLPEKELNSPKMVSAVNFLADLMLHNQRYDWKIGPRGHAIRALALYHERVFEGTPAVELAHSR